jgi:hypothetical protein
VAVEVEYICDLSAAVRGRQCSTLETIAKWMPSHWTFTDTDAAGWTFSDVAARWRPTTRQAGPKTSNMNCGVHYDGGTVAKQRS